MDKPLVAVFMVTYNHEKYISQAIESILMQKTTFAVILFIGEDCSTDRTSEICLKYKTENPDKIEIFFNQKNIGASSNAHQIYKACFSSEAKYIAMLEGDDYWTDPYKLQKQVEFLENNPDYGLVHGDVNHLYQRTGKMIKAYNRTNKIKITDGEIFEYLMKPSHSIKTMTVCFRRDLFEKHYLNNEVIMATDWRLIDISIWLMLSLHSKIHYFDEVFSTYRLLDESMSRTEDPIMLYQFHLKIHAIRDFYRHKYGCSNKIGWLLDVAKHKFLLADGYNMDNEVIANDGYVWLKRNKLLTLKERLLFLATKISLMKVLINLIIGN